MALLAFEAVARHHSFSRAAQQLNLTQGAISRQVQSLESFLDSVLFERLPGRVQLTAEGEEYLQRIQPALQTLESATLQLKLGQRRERVLSLACPPTFGSLLVIPHLPEFRLAHPNVMVHIISKIGEIDLQREGVDIGIQLGPPSQPGVVGVALMPEPLVCVCSQAFAQQQGPFDHPEQLLQVPLLQLSSRPQLWPQWFAHQGLRLESQMWGPGFEHFPMLVQAARADLGVALLPEFVVAEEMRDETLMTLFEPCTPGDATYYLCYRQHQATREPLASSLAWLQDIFAARH